LAFFHGKGFDGGFWAFAIPVFSCEVC